MRGLSKGDARGSVLLVALIVGMLVLFGGITVFAMAHTAGSRARGVADRDAAERIIDSGLAFISEQWRADPTFLDYTDADADGRATTFGECGEIGIARAMDGGTFTLEVVEDKELAASGVNGKLVTIAGDFRGTVRRKRALLGPNLLSPIQGVGTQAGQVWATGAQLGSTGAVRAVAFGNGNLGISNATIDGNVRMGGSVSIGAGGVISGAVQQGVSPVTFPNQQGIIDAAIDEANNSKPLGFWRDITTDLTQDQPVTAMEIVDANVSLMGGGWSSSNTPNMRHVFIRGGVSSLQAGSYAFGRLWLDGAILTIKAPPGGGTLVMPDVFLTNGARLIIDATDGPFTVVTGSNNAYETSTDVGSTNARRWDAGSGTFVSGAPSLMLHGGASSNIWNRTGGTSSGPKPDRGTGSGYDDWCLEDGSRFAVVTPAPAAFGFTLHIDVAADLVLTNGSRVMGGVQPGDLAALQDPATPSATLDAMPQNAPGFIVWSGGGNTPRLDIDAGAGAGGAPSSLTGLTYGGFEGNIGPGGLLTGAFVGYDLDIQGQVLYDSRLSSLLSSAVADTHHVIVLFPQGD